MTERYVLLDTDVISYIINGTAEAGKFQAMLNDRGWCLSFITRGEILYGAYKCNWGERRLHELRTRIDNFLSLGYDEKMPDIYARVTADCRRRGFQLSVNDAWIAATALTYKIPLATNNLKHFKPIPDLQLLSA